MQIHISRYFLLVLIFSHTLFGCALCTIYSPETRVAVTLNASETKIKSAKILWVLTKEFTQQLETVYDLDQNSYLDKNELIPVEQSLLDYIKPKNFLTHISYDKVINQDRSKPILVKEYKTYIKNSLLHFEYTLDLNYDLVKDNILFINVNDDESYFILLMAKKGIKINGSKDIHKVVNRQNVAFYISSLPPKIIENDKEDENLDTPKELIDTNNQKVEETLLSKYTKKLKEYLIKIEKGDDFALFTLLFISFLYGIIHALGPGHGKSLAFSYFISNKSSYTKAFLISQASAFIHIIGALVLVVVSVFILESILNNFVNDSVEILTKVSAVLIMILAIYILYNKFNHKSCSCSSCCSSEQKQGQWSTQAPTNTTTLRPNFMKKDLYFVLTAGLIPCPGTVILFIYAFILKTYLAVFLASIFISLGMGIVIFISSFLGVSLQKISSKSHSITDFLEIASPVVMFVLGILLFLNASII